jgi:hypothetical protein
MAFLRKRDKQPNRDKQPSQCNFAGKVVPVTNNLDEFIRNFHLAKPIGLSVKIKDWNLTYGEILSHGGSSAHNPFQIGEEYSCHLICANYNVEFDSALYARMGSDSMMSKFGVAPVNQCPACGSPNAIIVFMP